MTQDKVDVEETFKNSTIDTVLIYKSSALITRSFDFNLKKKSELTIDILEIPQSINFQSFSCKSFGKGNLLESSIHSYTKNLDEKKIKEIEKVIEDLKNQKKSIDLKITNINNSITHLNQKLSKFQLVSKGMTSVQIHYISNNDASDSEDEKSEDEQEYQINWKKTFSKESLQKDLDDFLSKSDKIYESIDEELNKLNSKKKELKEELLIISMKITENEKEMYHQEINWKMVIKLETESDGKFRLELSYLNPNCSWKSNYDLRLNTKKEELQLYYFAEIQQNTGENWKDVHVTLSSVDTALNCHPPELKKKNISYQYRPTLFDKLLSSESIQQQSDIIKKESKGNISSSGVSFSNFHIESMSNLPSDETFHKIKLTNSNLKYELMYYTVPKKEKKSYMKLTTTNNTNFCLLEGPVSVYIDNDFISTSKLNNINLNEKFVTYLGIDPSIKIEYDKPQKLTSQSGFFTKQSKHLIKRSITIKNTKSQKIEILVLDQLPKTETSSIKVMLIHPNLKQGGSGNKLEYLNYHGKIVNYFELKENNNVEWLVTLKGNEEITIPFQYFIEHPKDQPLQNLNF
eukprot:gene1571-12696_t